MPTIDVANVRLMADYVPDESIDIHRKSLMLQLEDSGELHRYADNRREERGHEPWTSFESDGWYILYAIINPFSTLRPFVSIVYFTDYPTDDIECGVYYDIPLSKTQQLELFDILNQQCKELHGKTIFELLVGCMENDLIDEREEA